MLQTLRPYMTNGLTVAGAAMVAVVPAAPRLPDVAEQLPQVRHLPVKLTGDPTGIFGLTQLLSDPAGSLSQLPDLLGALTGAGRASRWSSHAPVPASTTRRPSGPQIA